MQQMAEHPSPFSLLGGALSPTSTATTIATIATTATTALQLW
jgi:hypothetical protein